MTTRTLGRLEATLQAMERATSQPVGEDVEGWCIDLRDLVDALASTLEDVLDDLVEDARLFDAGGRLEDQLDSLRGRLRVLQRLCAARGAGTRESAEKIRYDLRDRAAQMRTWLVAAQRLGTEEVTR